MSAKKERNLQSTQQTYTITITEPLYVLYRYEATITLNEADYNELSSIEDEYIRDKFLNILTKRYEVNYTGECEIDLEDTEESGEFEFEVYDLEVA